MVRKMIASLVVSASLIGVPMLAGCDRTVHKEETVTKSPSGNVKVKEETVTKKADGSIEKKTETSNTRP